jgi:hypothetical protein
MIQPYKVSQEGSAYELSATLHKTKCCKVTHLVREAVADPSVSSTISTLRRLLWNCSLVTIERSADLLSLQSTQP